MNVVEILEWIKVHQGIKSQKIFVPDKHRLGSTSPADRCANRVRLRFNTCIHSIADINSTRNLEFFTPPRPLVFFGRVDMIYEIVNAVLTGQHIMLIGTGGVGKSSIAKAVLNEDAIVSSFEARVFITYDGVASSAMTYQLFLDRMADALNLTNANSLMILKRLETLDALLVIDNAETLLEADDVDSGRIAEVLDTLGSLKSTRIIVTSRNHASVSANFPCRRINVVGIPMDAACDAFSAIYNKAVNNDIRSIFTALDYHPLSINILANTAAMNQWDLEEIGQAWSERQTGVLENSSDKHRSLRAATEVSIVSFKNKTAILKILRAIAFLPQGLYRHDFPLIFPSVSNISGEVEAAIRSSLIYRNGDRLTMLAPIRMYIAEQYNHNLPYSDHVLSEIRSYYYSRLSHAAHDFAEREHGNIDRLMHFDMTSSHYRLGVEIRCAVLYKAKDFLYCTSLHPTSLWPLLVSETQVDMFNGMDSLAPVISFCLILICGIDYNLNRLEKALERLEVAEEYCCINIPRCNQHLVDCLQLKSHIFRARGHLALATKALEEGSSIAGALDDRMRAALLNQTLAGVHLLQGKFTEAASLYMSSQKHYEANNRYDHLISLLISRSDASISQNDFAGARLLLTQAIEIDQFDNGGRRRLGILILKASCEGWAGNMVEALKILREATEFRVSLGTSQFSDYVNSIRGRAYYEARTGQLANARSSIAQSNELRKESGQNLGEDLISALITNFAGETESAILNIRSILYQMSGDDRQFKAIYYRTLGEITLPERGDAEAKAYFEQAKTICDDTGISPKHLYVTKEHWYSLPVEYDGWDRFLDGSL